MEWTPDPSMGRSHPPQQPPPGFDPRALTDPVDRREVKAFTAELRSRNAGSVSTVTVITIIVMVILGGLMAPLLIAVTAMLLAELDSPAAAAIVAVLIGAAVVGVVVLTAIAVRNSRERRYRLDRFARANGMTYVSRVPSPALPGMIFNLGNSRLSTDLIRGSHPRFVEFGNYEYTVKRGKSSTTYRWGYVAVKLDVPLPHIVLDANGNNGFGSNLPASFDREQRLSLEGDFDDYFTLYCPAGYERDALYLFTPDIMARFIDNAAELDAEIIDDWLFLYTRRKISTLDPATWAWLFGVVGALTAKIDQWARWRDERLLAERAHTAASADSSAPQLPFAAPSGLLTPPPGVAFEGRRLKRSFPWLTVVMAIVLGALWLWSKSI